MSVRRLFVIDTDPGVDDSQAILMMLNAESRGEIQVLAITTVKGNVSLDLCTKNALHLLKLVKRSDIPVYAGARTALVDGREHPSEKYHGQNGMGDAEITPLGDDVAPQSEHAASALTRLARQYKGVLNIMALGPLTNLALAASADHNFIDNVNHFYVMGGNHNGMGNVTPGAEFNFFSDPEAAAILLRSVSRPITLVTWETCLQHALPLTWRKSLASDTAVGRFLDSIESNQLQRNLFNSWVTCDQMAAAVALRPNLVTESTLHQATIELHGQYTRGQSIIDQRPWSSAENANIKLVRRIDMELYKLMLKDVFGHSEIIF